MNVPQQIYQSALNILAMREHCQAELRQKLQRRFPEQVEAIELVLIQLVQDNLQSDRRYIDSFVRSRVSKGYGLMYIRYQLQLHKLDETLCREVLDAADVDGVALAKTVHDKKYGSARVSTIAEKAKRYRFLQSRGFSFDIIQQVVR